MIRNFWNLPGGRNSSNVLNVNFGLKKIKDAIIWRVNANFSFATDVEEFIWNANVWKKWEKNRKEEEHSYKKDEEEKRREWKMRLRIEQLELPKRNKNWEDRRSSEGRGKKEIQDRIAEEAEENDHIILINNWLFNHVFHSLTSFSSSPLNIPHRDSRGQLTILSVLQYCGKAKTPSSKAIFLNEWVE